VVVGHGEVVRGFEAGLAHGQSFSDGKAEVNHLSA
jgi:hypothetical protein